MSGLHVTPGLGWQRNGFTPFATPPTRDPYYWPFSQNSVWNLPIANSATFEAATDARTATLISTSFTIWANQNEFSHPVIRGSYSDPFVTFTDTNLASRSASFFCPVNPPIAPGSDKHLHVVQPEGRYVDECFGTTVDSATALHGGRHEKADLFGTGAGPNQGTRAYGGSAIGGLIRQHEVNPSHPLYTGEITHAIAIALASQQLYFQEAGSDYGYDQNGYGRSLGYVWPATEQDYDAATSYNKSTTACPMGTYFAIPPSVNVDALPLSPQGKMLGRALQNYGGYVTDRSSGFTFYVEQGSYNGFRDPLLASGAADLKTLRAQLRIVTNNAASTPNGGAIGAARRAALAPALPTPGY